MAFRIDPCFHKAAISHCYKKGQLCEINARLIPHESIVPATL